MDWRPFDVIRFASYRTAAKLCHVQKATRLHLVDIWNVIEAFRENGLNALDPMTEVKVSRLETTISTLLMTLNKRLPSDQQTDNSASTSLLLNWLNTTYQKFGIFNIFCLKMALATLCNSKPADKLKYIFSQISDTGGRLDRWWFCEFVRKVLLLPGAVRESPSFTYSEEEVRAVFREESDVTLNQFLATILELPGVPCLSWLPLMYRISVSETVVHEFECRGCRQRHFRGLRYQCRVCADYDVCQFCFWTGQVTPAHLFEHPMKEHATLEPPSRNSLRRSLTCFRDGSASESAMEPSYSELPEKPLNLSCIVPSRQHLPLTSGVGNGDYSHCNGFAKRQSRVDWTNIDEEHQLIAHYAACLLNPKEVKVKLASLARTDMVCRQQRRLIRSLEGQNRSMNREISSLRNLATSGSLSSDLATEVVSLRSRRQEMEGNLAQLQDSRQQLMQQLETLMQRLKTRNNPSSATNSLERGFSASRRGRSDDSRRSSLVSVSSSNGACCYSSNESLSSLDGDASSFVPSSAFSTLGSDSSSQWDSVSTTWGPNGTEDVRSDLLMAADSVTAAMSSLVRDLNCDASDEEVARNGITNNGNKKNGKLQL